MLKSLKSVVDSVDASGQAGLSERARRALEQYRRRAQLASTTVLVVALAVVAIVGGVSIFNLNNPTALKAAGTGLGLTLGGALILLRGIWKDWNYVNLLLVLVEDASDSQIKGLFDKLKRKL